LFYFRQSRDDGGTSRLFGNRARRCERARISVAATATPPENLRRRDDRRARPDRIHADAVSVGRRGRQILPLGRTCRPRARMRR
jgi:hypothetical protein